MNEQLFEVITFTEQGAIYYISKTVGSRLAIYGTFKKVTEIENGRILIKLLNY